MLRDFVHAKASRYRQARSGDLLVVNVHCWEGMFVHLEWFLEMAMHCEQAGLRPCFMSTSPPYVDPARGPDWYAYFFTNPRLTEEDQTRIRRREVPVCRIAHIGQLGLPRDYDSLLTLGTAQGLVRDYIGLRPEVSNAVDAFVDQHFRGRFVLGIHYRGTDKWVEAPRLSFEEVTDSIQRVLARDDRFDCLFVASDEQAFVNHMVNAFQSRMPVVCHDDQERSRTGLAVHQATSGQPFRRGWEAVINSLLLSRCHTLIKTPSILSGWSKLFNPGLETIMLASPYERHLWFPDRDLVQDSGNRSQFVT
jgi:hypothetical protein